jgi:hypothetical protein
MISDNDKVTQRVAGITPLALVANVETRFASDVVRAP